MNESIRSCKACGKKSRKQSLDRFVWDDEKPLLDTDQIMTGRGAYCCKDDKCEKRFLKMKKKWKRYFRL